MKIVAVAVFLIVILLIITERVHRTAAAMAGAMVLILTGVMSADKALSYIDFNTIGVRVGMMISWLSCVDLVCSNILRCEQPKRCTGIRGKSWLLLP